MNQLTIRKIPVAVEKRLRAHAHQHGMSLNRTAVSLLSQAVGIQATKKQKRKRDLSRFGGTLTAAQLRKFEENTRPFESIDKELWK